MSVKQMFGYTADKDSLTLFWERPTIMFHILFKLDYDLVFQKDRQVTRDWTGSMVIRIIEPAKGSGQECHRYLPSKELGDKVARVIASLTQPDETRQVWPTGPMIEKLPAPPDQSLLSSDRVLSLSYDRPAGRIEPRQDLTETITLTLRDGNTLAFKLEDDSVMEGSFLLRAEAFRAMTDLFDFIKTQS